MKDTIRIRPFRAEDAGSIVRLTGAVFATASIDARIQARFGGTSWKRIKGAVVRQEVERHPQGCFVAVRANRVVGYVTTTINPLAKRGTIANLAVAAACQGQGVGRRLIGRALRHFRQLGLRQAKIETLATNAAGQRLYPAMGFQEVVRQIHYAMALGGAMRSKTSAK